VCPDGVVWELSSGHRVVLGLPRGKGPTPLLPNNSEDGHVLKTCPMRYVLRYNGYEWVRSDAE